MLGQGLQVSPGDTRRWPTKKAPICLAYSQHSALPSTERTEASPGCGAAGMMQRAGLNNFVHVLVILHPA